MQPYLVHVERKGLMNWDLEFIPPGQTRHRMYRYANSHTAKVDGHIDRDDPSEMETWYANNEESANALALYLTTKRPDCNVNVYKLTAVSRTTVQPPVLTPYTERGLVPE